MIPGVIAVGASAGGITAIQSLLRSLQSPLRVPMVVVQHLPPSNSINMDMIFGRFAVGSVFEAVDKMPLEAGAVYFASGGYHLEVDRGGFLSLSLDPPVNFSRPSIDVLFHSVASAFAAKSCGIVLTGANADGAEGLLAVHQAGGVTIVQDPSEAEVPTMPNFALARLQPNHILRLNQIADLLHDRWGV